MGHLVEQGLQAGIRDAGLSQVKHNTALQAMADIVKWKRAAMVGKVQKLPLAQSCGVLGWDASHSSTIPRIWIVQCSPSRTHTGFSAIELADICMQLQDVRWGSLLEAALRRGVQDIDRSRQFLY